MDRINKDMMTEAVKKTIPVSVQIELLNQCNLRCVHCYLTDYQNKGLAFDVVINLLENLRKLGTLTVVFTGGEIFLRSDIFEIIQEARKRFFSVVLLSNISLLDEDDIQRLSELDIHYIAVSLYSLRHEIYKYITGEDILDRILWNLELLNKYKIRVRINMPIMRMNYTEIDEIRSYCKQHDFIFRSSPIIMPKVDGDQTNYKLRLGKSDFLDCIKKSSTYTIEEQDAEDLLEIFPEEICPMLKTGLSIDCLGNVYPCNSMYYKVGNIYESNIADILHFSAELHFLYLLKKNDLGLCNACEMVKTCKRCPAIVYSETGLLYGCSPTMKLINNL